MKKKFLIFILAYVRVKELQNKEVHNENFLDGYTSNSECSAYS